MIVVSGENIGPFKKFRLELNRYNLVFGPVGSGKSFLFRLLGLLDLVYTFTHYKLTEEAPETIFSRLLLLDEGLIVESRFSNEFVKKQVVNAILKHGESRGFLCIGVDNEELLVKLEKSGDRGLISISNIELLSKLLLIHIPQERIYSIEYSYISKYLMNYLV